MVNIIDNLCTKQEDSSIKSAVYNQEWFQIKRLGLGWDRLGWIGLGWVGLGWG